MDIKFVKPFFDGTVKVFDTMMQTKVVPQAPRFKEDQISLGDISAVVSMVGPKIAGTFVISFTEEVFLKIVSRMLMEEFTEIDNDILDAAAEIANMIYGNAKKDLIDQKICDLEKAIPNVVRGKNHTIKYQNGDNKIFIVPFNSDAGTFYIELCQQQAVDV